MLTARNLERVMALEASLRTEYQSQLDEKSAQIDAKSKEVEAAVKKQEQQQAVIAKQLEQITSLSSQATANKRTEQLNRELENRSEKLQEEVTSQKGRIKILQKDLAEVRADIKVLKQLDAVSLKKNLHTSKKKLAEKTTANDLLQKSTSKYKNENAELSRTVKQLEAKLAEFEDVEEAEEEEAAA